MSETRWTPGPWELRREGGDRHIYMNGERPAESQMCDMTYYPWVPDNDADWELIAAAPDLYEALALLVDLERGELVGSEFKQALYVALRESDAALAKARGKEPPR